MSPFSYVSTLLLVALAVLGSTIGSVFWCLGDRIEGGRWTNDALELKSRALKSRSPQLVILSGSSALFGISAERLHERYGVNAVNASTHAGLGLDYILRFGRLHIPQNCTVVLPLEYELYTGTRMEEALQNQAIGYDPAYVHSLSCFSQLQLALSLSPEARIEHLRAKLNEEERKDPRDFPYHLYRLTPIGDVAGNDKAGDFSGLAPQCAAELLKRYQHSDEAWDHLQAFAQELKKRGCQVVLTYPNLVREGFDLQANQAFFDELTARAQRIGLRLIGSPENNLFPESQGLDTPYHMNHEARQRNTDAFYQLLVSSGLLSQDNRSPANTESSRQSQ